MGRIMLLLSICIAPGCATLGPLNPMSPIERKLLYYPTDHSSVPAATDFESIQFQGGSGNYLHGLFLEHPSAKGVLLFCHGNGGNIVDRLPRLRQLRADHQLSVFGFDYRGYGDSGGKPSEIGLYEDARAARRWLSRKTNTAETDIVIMGRSLGGAVAVELATDGAKGLILESTFTSTADVGQSHVKWLPVSWLMSQKFQSVDKIANYQGPLLQMHGTADEVVPFQLGMKLHKKANHPKRFVTMNGGHNDASHPDYEPLLKEFVAGLFETNSATEPKQNMAVQPTDEFNCLPNSMRGRDLNR